MKKFLILLGMLVSFTACQYETIEISVNGDDDQEPIDETIILSFATDIAPIFSDKDCTACHTFGKTSPDLTAANAYQSLVDGEYVVSNDPAASLIYTYPAPDATTHRWKYYNSRQAEKIFTWINQGALNN